MILYTYTYNMTKRKANSIVEYKDNDLTFTGLLADPNVKLEFLSDDIDFSKVYFWLLASQNLSQRWISQRFIFGSTFFKGGFLKGGFLKGLFLAPPFLKVDFSKVDFNHLHQLLSS